MTYITYTYQGDFGKTYVYEFMKKHFNTIFVKLAGNMKDNKMAFWKACKERLDELNEPDELDEDAPGQTTSRCILKAPFVVFDVPRGGKIDSATLEFFEGYVKSPPYTHEKSEGSQFSIDIEPWDRIRSCLFWNEAPEPAVLRSISESACNVYIVSDTTEHGTLLPDENVKEWQKAYSDELRQRQQAGVEQNYRFAAQQINEAHGIAPDEVDSNAEFERLIHSSSYSFQEEKYKTFRGKTMACLEAPDGTKFSVEASTVNAENVGARLRNGAASERRRQKSRS